MSEQDGLDGAMRGLLAAFSRIDDDRHRRRVTHPLVNVLVIATSALLCGIDDIEGIADFAAARRSFSSSAGSGCPRQTPAKRRFAAPSARCRRCNSSWRSAAGTARVWYPTTKSSRSTARPCAALPATSKLSPCTHQGRPLEAGRAWARPQRVPRRQGHRI
jgi:hypothetical protein